MPAANHVCGVDDGPRKERGKEESVLAYLHTMRDGPIAKESLCNPWKRLRARMILVKLAKKWL